MFVLNVTILFTFAKNEGEIKEKTEETLSGLFAQESIT